MSIQSSVVKKKRSQRALEDPRSKSVAAPFWKRQGVRADATTSARGEREPRPSVAGESAGDAVGGLAQTEQSQIKHN
jgi:hypothetical protein